MRMSRRPSPLKSPSRPRECLADRHDGFRRRPCHRQPDECARLVARTRAAHLANQDIEVPIGIDVPHFAGVAVDDVPQLVPNPAAAFHSYQLALPSMSPGLNTISAQPPGPTGRSALVNRMASSTTAGRNSVRLVLEPPAAADDVHPAVAIDVRGAEGSLQLLTRCPGEKDNRRPIRGSSW